MEFIEGLWETPLLKGVHTDLLAPGPAERKQIETFLALWVPCQDDPITTNSFHLSLARTPVTPDKGLVPVNVETAITLRRNAGSSEMENKILQRIVGKTINEKNI